jgi:hypothetical protein
MHCFCFAQFTSDPTSVFDLKFNDIDPNDDTLYCQEWLINWGVQKAIIVGTSLIVVVINVAICFVFELLAKFERNPTQNDETKSMFQKITIM